VTKAKGIRAVDTISVYRQAPPDGEVWKEGQNTDSKGEFTLLPQFESEFILNFTLISVFVIISKPLLWCQLSPQIMKASNPTPPYNSWYLTEFLG
jgi:hypothetical protein